MLQEVDQSIKNLLLAELRANTDGLIEDESQIVLGLPPETEGQPPAKPTIHLFLHDVHEDLSNRDQSFEIRRSEDQSEVLKSRKPTRLNLSYLLTAHAKDSVMEHRILGEALGTLMRNGFVPPKHLVGSLVPFDEEAIRLSVAQRDHWAHMDGPKVWQATGHVLRPFVGIVASAMFDPFETKTVKLVREALFAIGQSTHPEGADRQMAVRSVRVSAAGTVSDQVGNAIPDVRVGVKGRSEETLTDAQGVFFFRNLPAGKHTLAFSKRGLEDVEEVVTAPERGLSNELQPIAVQMKSASDEKRASASKTEFLLDSQPNVLVGTLRYADGRAASFVPVRIGERTAVTDEQGMYHFTEVQKTAREIVAEVPGKGEKAMSLKPGAASVELPNK